MSWRARLLVPAFIVLLSAGAAEALPLFPRAERAVSAPERFFDSVLDWLGGQLGKKGSEPPPEPETREERSHIDPDGNA